MHVAESWSSPFPSHSEHSSMTSRMHKIDYRKRRKFTEISPSITRSSNCMVRTFYEFHDYSVVYFNITYTWSNIIIYLLRKTTWRLSCTDYHMLLLWKKKWHHFIKISGIAMEVLPLCSVDKAPSNQSSFSLLAPVSTKFTHLSMLFILELVCTDCSAGLVINE